MFKQVISLLEAARFTHLVAVPCSEFASFLRDAVSSRALPLLLPQREDEGIALMLGLTIAGMKPLGIFQDSLLGNAQNILGIAENYTSFPLKLWLGARTGEYLDHNPTHQFITNRLEYLLPPTCKRLDNITTNNSALPLSFEQEAVANDFLLDPTPGLQVLVFHVSG